MDNIDNDESQDTDDESQDTDDVKYLYECSLSGNDYSTHVIYSVSGPGEMESDLSRYAIQYDNISASLTCESRRLIYNVKINYKQDCIHDYMSHNYIIDTEFKIEKSGMYEYDLENKFEQKIYKDGRSYRECIDNKSLEYEDYYQKLKIFLEEEENLFVSEKNRILSESYCTKYHDNIIKVKIEDGYFAFIEILNDVKLFFYNNDKSDDSL